MAQNHQAIIQMNSRLETQLPGTGGTIFDALFGAGGTISGPLISPSGLAAIRLQKTGSDNVLGNSMASHAWVHAFLDPGASPPPIVFRTSEQIEMEYVGGLAGRGFFGYGQFRTVTDETSLRGIGFYADQGGNWIALIADDTGDLLRFDTGVAAEAVHLLSFDIDGGLLRQGVTFSIDGVQVARVAPLPRALDRITDAATLLLTQQIQGPNTTNMWFASGNLNMLAWISEAAGMGGGFTPCDGCD